MAQVIYFDPDARRPCANCHKIRDWSRKAAEDLGARFSTALRWSRAAEESLVVIVRCVGGQTPDGFLRSDGVQTLAVICQPRSGEAGFFERLADCFDDFVCCLAAEAEYVARLRRLIAHHTAAGDLSLRGDLIGKSPLFLKALQSIGPIARSCAPALIQGETGVGKELFARAIHYNSPRAAKPFVPLNCSALPDHLFENELFGHVPGAFTDARSTEKGLLGEANGGTLFLDEVDMLAPGSQAKLLRFLQDREYRPLGSSKALMADVRVVAASNADLLGLVRERQFREDLFHRLNVLPFTIPALRERPGDVPLLAEHFARRFGAQYGKPEVRFSDDSLARMSAYEWPGNVRELEGAVHRAVVFAESDLLEAPELADAGDTPRGPDTKDAAMQRFERAYLMNLLSENGGNLSHSAVACGKDRRTLQRLLRKHEIDRVSFRTGLKKA